MGFNASAELFFGIAYTKDEIDWEVRERAEVIKASGVSIGYHGYIEGSHLYLYIPGTKFETELGEPKEIPYPPPAVATKSIEDLKTFCKLVGLPFKRPCWNLVAVRG